MDGSLDYIKKILNILIQKKMLVYVLLQIWQRKKLQLNIFYSHDDMYFCPGWDECLLSEIKLMNTNAYYFSGTMIEKNSGHIQLDCGDDYKILMKKSLLNEYKNISFLIIKVLIGHHIWYIKITGIKLVVLVKSLILELVLILI